MHRFKIPLGGLAAAVLLMGGRSVSALDSPALTLARQLNEAFIEVADKVSPTVVVIEVTEKVSDNENGGSWWDVLPPDAQPQRRRHRHNRPQMGEGSGIIVSEDGYILTNNHVVENADKIEVKFKDGRTYSGEVKGTDPQSDIAVIKIKATGLTPAKLGDSDLTRVGEFVLAVGAPFALSYSVTFGHVSAKGRSFEGEMQSQSQGPTYQDQDFIQTDASINPGNSGGPLVNLYGEVIAINTMIEGLNTGIGFAVPINLAKRVKDHLIAEGKFTRSWIGVGIAELRDYSEYQNLDKALAPDTDSGIVITGIMAGGPASKSGLLSGDVVTSVGGKKVETARQLKDAIALTKPGTTLALNVVRAREHLTLKVQTAALPNDFGAAAAGPQSDLPSVDTPSLGLTVQSWSKDLADHFGIEGNSGIVVTAVENDSPAEAEGIKAGDVIKEINRQRITTLRQYRQAMHGVDSSKGVMIDVVSNGSSRMVILKAADK